MDFFSLLEFLEQLKKNNNRDWFIGQEKVYKGLRKSFEQFVQELITSIAVFDPDVAPLTPKECIFRLNRDIRFSKDKSPYKTNFGASIAKGGKKSPYAGYYIHIEPSGSFLAGGVWMPESENLARIRQEIDYNSVEFLKLLHTKVFRSTFESLKGECLKTAPKGYAIDHPLIEYLRLKSFIMSFPVSDKQLLNGSVKKFSDIYKIMKPVNNFLNQALET